MIDCLAGHLKFYKHSLIFVQIGGVVLREAALRHGGDVGGESVN